MARRLPTLTTSGPLESAAAAARRSPLASKRLGALGRNALRVVSSTVSDVAPLGPKGVNLPLVNVCNTNCTFCPWFAEDSKYVSIGRARAKVPAGTPPAEAEALRPRYLPLEDVERIARDLREMKVEEVTISGFGEALVHPDIEAICELLGRHHLTIVITNGIGLGSKRLERLLRHRVVLRLSLHAADRDTWHRIHPMNHPRNFDEICAAVRHIQARYGDRIAVHNVLCRESHDQVEAIYDLCRSLGVRQVSYFPVITKHLAHPDRHAPTAAERAVTRAQLERVAARARDDGLETNAGELARVWAARAEGADGSHDVGDLYRHVDCRIGYVMALITPDKKIKPCCQCEPIASFADSSFREAWNGPAYRRFRAAGKRIRETGTVPGCDCRRCENFAPNVKLHGILHPFDRDRAAELADLDPGMDEP